MSSQSTKILVVEDEEMIREILVDEFSEIADEVFFAENGQQALTILEQNPDIDAMFSDISMPIMDGLELLEEVSKKYPNIASVILSAYGDKKNTAKALKLGAMDFIDKPFQIRDVQATAKEAIELGTLNKKISSQLDEMLSDMDIPEDKLEEYKAMKHNLLLLQYRKQKVL